MSLLTDLISYYKLDGDSTDEVGSADGSDTAIRYDLFENYFLTDDDQMSAYGASQKVGQQFTPKTSHTITSVSLKILRLGSPGTITVSIYNLDGSGYPTGAAIASGNYNGNTVTDAAGGAWYEISLGAGAALTASTKYGIVLTAPSGDTDNRITMRMDASSPTYPGGGRLYMDNGVNWTTTTAIVGVFAEYGTGDSGIINDGAGFNGVSSTITNASTFTLPTNATIACWFKTSINPVNLVHLFGYQSFGGAPQFKLRVDNGTGKVTGLLYNSAGEYSYCTSTGALNDNTWHHAVFTRDGDNVVLYIDGSANGTPVNDDLSGGNFNNFSLEIGANNATYFYAGAIDECAYWERTLDSTEVGQLYNSGAGLPYPLTVGQTIDVSDTIAFAEVIKNNMEAKVSDTISFVEAIKGNLQTIVSDIISTAGSAIENLSIKVSETIAFVESIVLKIPYTKRTKPARGTYTPRTKPEIGTYTKRTKPAIGTYTKRTKPSL